jgi:hypothetical protein
MKLGTFEFDRIKRLGAFEKDLGHRSPCRLLCLPEREKVE